MTKHETIELENERTRLEITGLHALVAAKGSMENNGAVGGKIDLLIEQSATRLNDRLKGEEKDPTDFLFQFVDGIKELVAKSKEK